MLKNNPQATFLSLALIGLAACGGEAKVLPELSSTFSSAWEERDGSMTVEVRSLSTQMILNIKDNGAALYELNQSDADQTEGEAQITYLSDRKSPKHEVSELIDIAVLLHDELLAPVPVCRLATPELGLDRRDPHCPEIGTGVRPIGVEPHHVDGTRPIGVEPHQFE